MEIRIFNEGIIPHYEKTFSLYKPYTEWINKGKAGVPVELGVKVCIMEDQFGFILNHRIMYTKLTLLEKNKYNMHKNTWRII